MLKPDAAKQQLKQFMFQADIEKDGDFDASVARRRFLPAIKKLPAKLRAIGYSLLDFGPKGDKQDELFNRQQLYAFQEEQSIVLENLPIRERVRLLQIFFGNMSSDVEQAWHWFKSTALTSNGAAPPFRIPTLPELTLTLRRFWLQSLVELACAFKNGVLTPTWLAAWVPHMRINWQTWEYEVGFLLASVIDSGGKTAEEVLGILLQSARNEHEIGAMGRHVTTALLSSSRQEGWELIEKTLLAAQRQEGLRQAILDSMDSAHPEAFRRMLRLIVEHKMVRFSSVVRQLDEWFGLQWSSQAAKKVNDTIELLADLLEKPAMRKSALSGDDPERAYFALWSISFENAEASIKPAEKLLDHQNPEFRFAGILHLTRIRLPDCEKGRLKALQDDNRHVATIALTKLTLGNERQPATKGTDVEACFSAIERLVERMPQKKELLNPLIWPWTEREVSQSEIASKLITTSISPLRIVPHMKYFDPRQRAMVVRLLGEQEKWNAQTRGTLLEMAGDAAGDVRRNAIDYLAKAKLNDAEIKILEGNLKRTTNDLRNGIVGIINALPDKRAQASAERLLASDNKNQRLAGLEIIRLLAESNRDRSKCIEMISKWRDSRKKMLKSEESQVKAILDSDRVELSLDDALGLMNPDGRSKPIVPKCKSVQLPSPSIAEILKSLDNLVHIHREEKYEFEDAYGTAGEALLGEAAYRFPYPFDQQNSKVDLPLREIWETWLRDRPANCRDSDGMELVRTFLMLEMLDGWPDARESFKEIQKTYEGFQAIEKAVLGDMAQPDHKYDMVVKRVVAWLFVLNLSEAEFDFCLDLLETICAMVPRQAAESLDRETMLANENPYDRPADWRELQILKTLVSSIRYIVNLPHFTPTSQQDKRYWQLLHWLDEPSPGCKRFRPDSAILNQAYLGGHATIDDVADHLLGPDRETRYYGQSYGLLEDLTARSPTKRVRGLFERPEISELVSNAVSRILDIELARGETATAASNAAISVSAFRGIDTLIRLLSAIGNDGFKKLSGWRENVCDNRLATLTKMVSKTYPSENDTHADFISQMRSAVKTGIFPEERILQLAFLAPQWTKQVEATMKWDGFAEGLYWYMAHMRYVWGMTEGLEQEDDSDEKATNGEEVNNKSPERMSRWQRLILERTPLTTQDRNEGAIDVSWFHRTYKQLTPKRWEAMSTAARFAATPAQARRAKMIADVLLGKTPRKKLIDGIRKRNLKENVRLLGLLPLAKGAKRDKDLAERYEVLNEYQRYANSLSSMSKPDALRAVEIGLQNLASTAGYADPIRLQWALEAESTKDLADGLLVVSNGDVSLTLGLDERSEPKLMITRGDKLLKSLPKSVANDKKFVELRERSRQLKQQSSRMRRSLEAAMCRGDKFTGAELMQLADHSILWPQLSRLILIGEGIAGYPEKRGKVLRDFSGKLEPVKKNEQIRIAHPHDLLQLKSWDKWQHECFAAERLQPFKQVFRELYVVTSQEKKDNTFSARYAGHQVQPRQATALWGSRGWSANEYGEVFKTYHNEAINVSMSFNHGFTTPLEVEGLTIENVSFHSRDTHEPIPLTSVPPRIFSETMRDVDLVVSVAHAGGIDPEASASTVEMRANLLRETCQLLNLKNVKIKDSRVLIQGELSEYSVHLGSGIVHRMPGGSICLVPVHSQHRGRLFLPFADDDPRTAEVVSKTLMLARDDEITDPIILEQLRV
jgi:hypothetical protein